MQSEQVVTHMWKKTQKKIKNKETTRIRILKILVADGEKVWSFWSSASTSKFSSIIFCMCIYNVIILIAHLILLLSYYCFDSC